MRNALCIALGSSVLAFPAIAGPTFQSLWSQVAANPACKSANYPDFTLVTCDSEMTMWYFTKPNHPAYPGVIKRMIKQRSDGAWVAQEDGHSFAPDSAQPAFKKWLAQIEDLDRQAREELKRETGH
jgi:hypothetical protein